MKAAEFNELYDKLIVERLESKCKFVKKKTSRDLFFKKDDKEIALIRKSFRDMPVAYIFLCMRHCCVNEITYLDQSDPNGYPFKLSPLEINRENIKQWHYIPRFFGMGYDGEVICFSEEKIYGPLYGEYRDVPTLLELIYEKVSTVAFDWMNFLTPIEALKQLTLYSKKTQAETDWINDYKRYADSISDWIDEYKKFNAK